MNLPVGRLLYKTSKFAECKGVFDSNPIQAMYSCRNSFLGLHVLILHSVTRSGEVRIDKEESVANAEKRRYRNPITGQGFAKERRRKQRGREENRVLVNNYGISKQSSSQQQLKYSGHREQDG